MKKSMQKAKDKVFKELKAKKPLHALSKLADEKKIEKEKVKPAKR
ncbi:MAG TPA: hypothetical protein VKZ95_01350 [Sphingobacteriaceae bacterium]|nr:hypothetical protein [Sphingobacteriaceae bacterium]